MAEPLHSIMLVYVRLTRKLANALTGLDLRSFNAGDVIQLKDSSARTPAIR